MKLKKRVVPILIVIGILAIIFSFRDYLFLEEIGSISEDTYDFATINGRKFREYGGFSLSSTAFQWNKRPIGRIDNRPVYELGENTAYLVRNPADRMGASLYYDAQIYPDGLPKNGKITGFVVQYSADFELDKYYTDKKVVAYFNNIYTTSPDLLVNDKEKWVKSEGDPSIRIFFCFENAPISLETKKFAYLRKTDQEILVSVWDEKRDESGEAMDDINWKTILDKVEGEMFEPYFEIKKKYMDK